jgi:hypothetical protein
LKFTEYFIQSSRNETAQRYNALAIIGKNVRNLGAATVKQLANTACNSNSIGLKCLDEPLVAVLPASFNSNNMQDTGGLQLISPAQVSFHAVQGRHLALTSQPANGGTAGVWHNHIQRSCAVASPMPIG